MASVQPGPRVDKPDALIRRLIHQGQYRVPDSSMPTTATSDSLKKQNILPF